MRATPLGMRLLRRPAAPAGSTTVWNAATSGPNVTISGAGLIATFASSSGDIAKALNGHSGTGDWWFDLTPVGTSGNAQVGLCNATEGNTGGVYLGDSANSVGWNWNDGTLLGATGTPGAFSSSGSDVLRIRLKNNFLYLAKNGTYVFGDPVAETGGADMSGKGALFPAVSTAGVWQFTADFTSWP
jgi:hypothetical protein